MEARTVEGSNSEHTILEGVCFENKAEGSISSSSSKFLDPLIALMRWATPLESIGDVWGEDGLKSTMDTLQRVSTLTGAELSRLVEDLADKPKSSALPGAVSFADMHTGELARIKYALKSVYSKGSDGSNLHLAQCMTYELCLLADIYDRYSWVRFSASKFSSGGY